MVEAGVQLSQYRIVRRIGAGGMAEVFLASKVGVAGFSRPVAIKTIVAAGAAQESIGLFLDEARVAAMLQHAAIVQTYDLGFENDTLFIAMEYVPGPPLSRVIQELKSQSKTMPPHVAAYIGARMANALDFAHRRVKTATGQALKLVHRDVSPQNILVSRTGMLKLMDFGVARASIQMHKTRTGQVRGKAAYMAPEQVRAQALDGRTDMFALGLVLYECLTAFRPFQRHNEIASMRAIIGEDVPPIRERNPEVPVELAEVIHKSLKRNPSDRYAHCGELEETLTKTIKKHRASAIEEEIVALVVQLFGNEQYADELPDVEAWHPTLASTTTPVTPRFKVPGAGLSPEIAAMLGQTPNTPVQPSLTPATTAMPDLEGLPRGHTQPPQRPPPGPAPTPPASRSTPDSAVPATSNEFIQQVVEAANAQLTPASSVNLRGTVGSSNGQLQGVLYPTTPMLSPLSSPSIVGMTPPSLSAGPAQQSRGKLVMIVGASLVGGAALVLVLQSLLSPPVRVEQPIPSAEQPAVSVGVVTPSVAPSPSAAAQSPSPAAQSPSPAAPSPSSSGEPRDAPPSRRPDPGRPRGSASPSASAAAPSPSRSAAPSPTKNAALPSRDALTSRALIAKKKAEVAGRPDLAGPLSALINNLMAGQDATASDVELVRQSEAALP